MGLLSVHPRLFDLSTVGVCTHSTHPEPQSPRGAKCFECRRGARNDDWAERTTTTRGPRPLLEARTNRVLDKSRGGSLIGERHRREGKECVRVCLSRGTQTVRRGECICVYDKRAALSVPADMRYVAADKRVSRPHCRLPHAASGSAPGLSVPRAPHLPRNTARSTRSEASRKRQRHSW